MCVCVSVPSSVYSLHVIGTYTLQMKDVRTLMLQHFCLVIFLLFCQHENCNYFDSIKFHLHIQFYLYLIKNVIGKISNYLVCYENSFK